jgi:hypothetical protein
MWPRQECCTYPKLNLTNVIARLVPMTCPTTSEDYPKPSDSLRQLPFDIEFTNPSSVENG